MKQVSNAINSFVLSTRHLFSMLQWKTSGKYLGLLFLAGFAITGSSFVRGNVFNNSHNIQKADVSFKGKFALSLVNGVSGTGTGSHIGRFTLVAYDDESNFPNITGNVIITAANGDQIFATHTGFAQELGGGMLQVDFQNMITGGTGRFAGATGSFDINADVNETIGTGYATFNGTINY